jgi:hypothetical protein
MNGFGGMPGRAYAYSAAFHVAVVLMLFSLVHFHLFERKIDEEQPIVVQLVNVAPETHATQVTHTPPKPNKPTDVAEVETPKPPQPKPEPPKPEPPPESKPEPAQAAAPPPPPPPPPEPQPKQQEAKLEPQPQPKQQEAKAEPQPPLPQPPPEKPQPPKKKNDDTAFDALLKNLAKHDPVHEPVDQPQKQAAAVPKSSSQPIASLATQLTTSELDVVKQQIEQCWNVPAGARDAKDLTPEFRVYMNRDGTIQSATQLNPDRNGDPYFQAAAEAAARALHNPHCQPLKLPPDKYDQWQTFTITFDPKDL